MAWPNPAMVSLVADDPEEALDFAGEHDPEAFGDDEGDYEARFTDILTRFQKLSRSGYGKDRKQDIFATAVSLHRKHLFLGQKPDALANRAYRVYSKQTVEKRKWLIPAITRPFYQLSRFVHDFHSVQGERAFANLQLP